jgi:hypothetical protein
MPRRTRRALALLAAAALLALLLLAGRSTEPSPAAAQVQCPSLPSGLAPKSGPGSSRFTMLIRINTQGNVSSRRTSSSSTPASRAAGNFQR